MARIAGVNLPNQKRLEIGLTYIFGIGRPTALQIAAALGLSPDKHAIVTMRIQKGVKVTDDAIVSVKTSGLIGDKYLKITPGGAGEPLAPGGLLTDTESSVDIQELIGKYVFGGVKEEKK